MHMKLAEIFPATPLFQSLFSKKNILFRGRYSFYKLNTISETLAKTFLGWRKHTSLAEKLNSYPKVDRTLVLAMGFEPSLTT